MKNLNMRSQQYSGTTTLQATVGRRFIAVKNGAGALTVTLGGGDAINVGAGETWEPEVCPSSEVVLDSTGTYTVTTNIHA